MGKDWLTGGKFQENIINSISEINQYRLNRFIQELINIDPSYYEITECIEKIYNSISEYDKPIVAYLSIDELENMGVWDPYNESFSDLIDKLSSESGVIF